MAHYDEQVSVLTVPAERALIHALDAIRDGYSRASVMRDHEAENAYSDAHTVIYCLLYGQPHRLIGRN